MSAPPDPPATPAPPPVLPAQKRGVSPAAVVVLVVGVVCVLLGTYYAAEVRGFFGIKPWNKTAPKAFVAQYVAAMRAEDAATVKSLTGGSVQVIDEGGRLTKLKTGGPMAPARPATDYLPSGDPNQGTVSFRVTATQAFALVGVSAADGKTLEFKVSAEKGGWKVTDIRQQ